MGANPACTEVLRNRFDQELKEYEYDEEFNYCQWDTTDRATLATITTTYGECKETLIDTINDLTRHSYISNVMHKI